MLFFFDGYEEGVAQKILCVTLWPPFCVTFVVETKILNHKESLSAP